MFKKAFGRKTSSEGDSTSPEQEPVKKFATPDKSEEAMTSETAKEVVISSRESSVTKEEVMVVTTTDVNQEVAVDSSSHEQFVAETKSLESSEGLDVKEEITGMFKKALEASQAVKEMLSL